MNSVFDQIAQDCILGFNSLELALKYNINHDVIKDILEKYFITHDFKVNKSNKTGDYYIESIPNIDAISNLVTYL